MIFPFLKDLASSRFPKNPDSFFERPSSERTLRIARNFPESSHFFVFEFQSKTFEIPGLFFSVSSFLLLILFLRFGATQRFSKERNEPIDLLSRRVFDF